MRLGVAFWSGVIPGDVDGTVKRLGDVGVKGLGHVSILKGWDEDMLRRFREGMEAQDCFVGEVTMYQFGWMLAQSDETIRQEALDELTRILHDAATLNAHCVGISVIAGRPGHDNPWSPKVWQRLVDGVGMAAAEGERVGIDLAFHPVNCGSLDRPEQLRRLVDDVASPRVKVILDPVNMTDHRTAFDNTDFLNEMFDLLGEDTVAAHAKDYYFDDSHLITKIDEVPLGTGAMDYETYVRRLAELDDSVLFCIEHFRDVGVSGTTDSPVYVNYETDIENARACSFIHSVAGSVGVELR